MAGCFLISALGIARGLRWRLVPLLVGLVLAASAMAVVAVTSLAGVPGLS
jgi:hypothetical protein